MGVGADRYTIKRYKRRYRHQKPIKLYRPKYRVTRNIIYRGYPAGGPRELRAKLIYFGEVNYDPNASGIALNVFNASSVYQCDTTGAAGQPMKYDQIITMYPVFTVVGSKITADFMFPSSANNSPYRVGITKRDNGVTDSIDDYMEDESTVYDMIAINASDVNNRRVRLVNTCSTARFWGRPLTETIFSGTSTSNPTNSVYYHVWIGEVDGVQKDIICKVSVRIEYSVLFRDKQAVEGS